MNRLTCKPDETINHYYYETTEKTEGKDRIAILNKLGKLEDIEERIGIDLIRLFDGLGRINSSIYIRHKGSIINVPVSFGNINLYNGCGAIGKGKPMYFFDLEEGQYFLEDCGNTWAFTKEELEAKGDRNNG